jgi:hypothetical protein
MVFRLIDRKFRITTQSDIISTFEASETPLIAKCLKFIENILIKALI